MSKFADEKLCAIKGVDKWKIIVSVTEEANTH
jgi:hypothetical protein